MNFALANLVYKRLNRVGLPHVKLKQLVEQLLDTPNVVQSYGFESFLIKRLQLEQPNQEWEQVKGL
jgi:hypothetical protein